ncbi:MAG: DUF1573 domain-containing protein [Isosphaeraceae bacterium]
MGRIFSKSFRVWVGFVLACGAVGQCHAANWADSLFSERGHDFGTVPRGVVVNHPFVITNRLNEILTILEVHASCGCTKGRVSATTIPPGGTAVVEAQMDTRNFVNRKATTLFVSLATASGRQAEVRLAVVSTILSDIVLNPGSVDFGLTVRGNAPSATVTIDRLGSSGWKIERMISNSKVLDFKTTKLVETYRSNDRVGYAVQMSLRADAPIGPFRDEIRLITNDPLTASIPINVGGQVLGGLSVSPNVLSLGQVAGDGLVQGRFLVRGAKPFAILQVAGAGDGFEIAPIDPKMKKTIHLITVSYRPKANSAKGDIRRVFHASTDVSSEPPLELITTAHVEP